MTSANKANSNFKMVNHYGNVSDGLFKSQNTAKKDISQVLDE